MKYEEWIQYEEKRLNQQNPLAWIVLDATRMVTSPDQHPYPPNGEKPPVWAVVVQVFNSRRI